MADLMQMPATERHYTLREIADMWQISYQTARRMFQDEPGVLAFSLPRLGGGRPHISPFPQITGCSPFLYVRTKPEARPC